MNQAHHAGRFRWRPWLLLGALVFCVVGCGGSRLVIDDQVRAAAASGDADAAFKLGTAYDFGTGGVDRDATQAFDWYRKAAESGHAAAAQSLGFCYEHGYGVRQNYGEARRWYATSIDRGNAGAAHNLGFLYDLGSGGAEDNRRAVELYRKAAAAGSPEAMVNLGMMYGAGDGGLREDAVEAYAWIDLGRFYAASRDTKWRARGLLDGMKSRGLISSEQIKAARSRSTELTATHNLYRGKAPKTVARR